VPAIRKLAMLPLTRFHRIVARIRFGVRGLVTLPWRNSAASMTCCEAALTAFAIAEVSASAAGTLRLHADITGANNAVSHVSPET
jgi:hypothetical protein